MGTQPEHCTGRSGLRLAWLSLMLGVAGCGAAEVSSGEPSSAEPYAELWPEAAGARESEAHRLGRTLFQALQSGDGASILMTTEQLEETLHPEVYIHVQRRRTLARTGHGGNGGLQWRGTEYLGACFQGVRREPADTSLGLRRPTGVVDRVLIVGRRADGTRLATWVEGSLVRIQGALRAISSLPIESPRWGAFRSGDRAV